MAISDLAKQYAPEALQALVTVMHSTESPAAAVVAAANSLLDRGYGRPVQAVESRNEHTVRGQLTISPEGLAQIEDVVRGMRVPLRDPVRPTPLLEARVVDGGSDVGLNGGSDAKH